MIAALFVLALLQSPSKPFIPSWAGLEQPYEYKHLDPANVTNVKVVDDGTTVKTTFEFPGTPGDTVQGILAEPKSSKPVPIVLLLHGLSGNKEQMIQMVGNALLAKGIGYAAIDAPGHGTRQTADDQKIIQTVGAAFFASTGDLLKSMLSRDPDHQVVRFLDRAVHDGVLDNRHLLDYLTSRPDVDYHRIGLIGDSMGSIMGTILGAVDPRVKIMLLMVGGDPGLPLLALAPPDLEAKGVATCCSLYAPHFQGSVRMLSGSKDSVIPRDATDRLYNAFPESERTIGWYNSNHFLPQLANEEAVQWTADHLGVH